MRRFLVVAFVSSLLAACATISPERQAELQRIANQPIFCESKEDCEIKWGRAILWITKNSSWKLRQQTDQLITTEGPFDTCDAAFTVNKLPLGNNKYQIIMDCWCGNIFGCIPDTLSLRADFNQFVSPQSLGSASSPTAPAGYSADKPILGIKFMDLPAMLTLTANHKGIFIVKVDAGSVAEKSGIKVGDILYEYDGTPITCVKDFQAVFASSSPNGKTVPLKISRGRQDIDLTAQF